MIYRATIKLKNGKEALLRNGDANDGQAVYDCFNLAHAESDYLLSYPEENSFTPEQESEFLQKKTDSYNEIEMVAIVNNKVVGVAGIEAVGHKYKVKHRAEFGISRYSLLSRRMDCMAVDLAGTIGMVHFLRHNVRASADRRTSPTKGFWRGVRSLLQMHRTFLPIQIPKTK